MHAEINVRFEISIDERKELFLATLAEVITDQQVESLLLESIVERPRRLLRRGALWRETPPR
jgi:hypothetical protein